MEQTMASPVDKTADWPAAHADARFAAYLAALPECVS
jgi:hypothetical protein